VPDVAAPTPTASAGPLTQAEIDAWQNMLDNWDAFMVFAIKQLGSAVDDKAVRAQLLDTLLDGRYRLVQALRQPQGVGGPDPVRLLFLDEWTRLRAIIRSTAQRGMLANRTLQFLSLVSAGDALFALDQAAPTLGFRISADDLRRLARIMAPQSTADPLAFSFDVDPQLQQMFGVSAPLESRGPIEEPLPSESQSPTPTASSSPSPVGPPPIPTLTPTLPPSTVPSPHAFFWRRLHLFDAASAEAAENTIVPELLNIGAALNRVVVDGSNQSEYTRSVQRLLSLAAQREINEASLSSNLQRTYSMLVESTGWQESCWRQFIRRAGRIRYLESSTGDIGLMQINKHVWRGFYNLRRVEWDVVYNTTAGAEILMRLMRDAATQGISNSRAPDIARSTYSAYNGGPDAYNRWRDPDESTKRRRIDESFWAKYQAITSGRSFDILQCALEWDIVPGH
jgi:hypothetical protein